MDLCNCTLDPMHPEKPLNKLPERKVSKQDNLLPCTCHKQETSLVPYAWQGIPKFRMTVLCTRVQGQNSTPDLCCILMGLISDVNNLTANQSLSMLRCTSKTYVHILHIESRGLREMQMDMLLVPEHLKLHEASTF